MDRLFEILSKRHELAKEYAKHAHNMRGQRRKGSNEPYYVHPLSVSDVLEAYDAPEEVCCAACLHDTIEDTDVKYDDIVDCFGEDIADLVDEVTNSPDLDGLGKEDYMNQKLLKISDDALIIKLGDMLHNCLDKPRLNQIERMKKNLEFIKKKRKGLKGIHHDLIDSFFTGFYFKKRELVNIY